MKIKNVLVALLVFSMSASGLAAELSEAAFKSWMSGLTIDGTKLREIEKDGETVNAMFANPVNPHIGGRMISISPLKAFLDYQKALENPKMRMGPTTGFVFRGLRTVVVDTQSEIGILAAIEAKNIKRTFVLSFPPKTNQAAIEAGLVSTGLYQK